MAENADHVDTAATTNSFGYLHVDPQVTDLVATSNGLARRGLGTWLMDYGLATQVDDLPKGASALLPPNYEVDVHDVRSKLKKKPYAPETVVKEVEAKWYNDGDDEVPSVVARGTSAEQAVFNAALKYLFGDGTGGSSVQLRGASTQSAHCTFSGPVELETVEIVEEQAADGTILQGVQLGQQLKFEEVDDPVNKGKRIKAEVNEDRTMQSASVDMRVRLAQGKLRRVISTAKTMKAAVVQGLIHALVEAGMISIPKSRVVPEGESLPMPPDVLAEWNKQFDVLPDPIPQPAPVANDAGAVTLAPAVANDKLADAEPDEKPEA
jgi:hypothetical protein